MFPQGWVGWSGVLEPYPLAPRRVADAQGIHSKLIYIHIYTYTHVYVYICMYVCMSVYIYIYVYIVYTILLYNHIRTYIYIYIYIYICMHACIEKGEVLLRVVGTLRYVVPPNASVQWQPDGLTIPTHKWLLGVGLL